MGHQITIVLTKREDHHVYKGEATTKVFKEVNMWRLHGDR